MRARNITLDLQYLHYTGTYISTLVASLRTVSLQLRTHLRHKGRLRLCHDDDNSIHVERAFLIGGSNHNRSVWRTFLWRRKVEIEINKLLRTRHIHHLQDNSALHVRFRLAEHFCL